MNRAKIKYAFLALGGLMVFFLAREIFWVHENSLQFFAEKNVIWAKNNRDVLVFGDADSRDSQMVFRGFSSFFADQNDVFNLQSRAEKITKFPQKISGESFSVDFLSPRIFRATFFLGENQSRVFFFQTPKKAELENLFAQKIRRESDFWVLTSASADTLPINFLPPPKQGILFLSPRIRGKTLSKYSLEHDLPVISVGETGGFSLELEGDEWHLRVRQSAK